MELEQINLLYCLSYLNSNASFSQLTKPSTPPKHWCFFWIQKPQAPSKKKKNHCNGKLHKALNIQKLSLYVDKSGIAWIQPETVSAYIW